MSLKVILLLVAVPIFVICCAILLKYRNRFKKPPKQHRGHRKIEKVPETVITIERVPETVITICHDEMPDNQHKIEKVPETVITICLEEIPDNQNEAEEKMAKPIFISADCWLKVFDLLNPCQLGLGISMISHRFDFYVDEHFKTRRWALECIRIQPKFEADGTKQMEILNSYCYPMQIPQNPLPRNVVGFEVIKIRYINDNVITFLRCFRPIFAVFPIHLAIVDTFVIINSTLDSVLRNIWPMIATNICAIQLSDAIFSRLRLFVPSILDDCPSLRVFNAYYDGFFAEFPADDSATASNGQTVAKWLFTPRPDGVPKVFKCWLRFANDVHLESSIEAFKREFTNASSPVNFIAVIRFPPTFADSVLLFNLTNGFTHEQLTLTWMNDIGRFLLIRCPIVRDTNKWAKWEEEAIDWQFYDQWNKIDIWVS